MAMSLCLMSVTFTLPTFLFVHTLCGLQDIICVGLLVGFNQVTFIYMLTVSCTIIVFHFTLCSFHDYVVSLLLLLICKAKGRKCT